MDKALTWFTRIWISFGIIVNLLSATGFFLADGFWGGLSRIQEIFSPFNVVNYVLELVLFSPAIAAYWWQQKRRQKQAADQFEKAP